MAACILFWAGLGWWAATIAVQWISAGLGRWRRPADPVRHGAADFSIVAPLVGVRDASPAYVRRLAEHLPVAQGGKIDFSVDFYDFGAPVSVTPPPASETLDLGTVVGGG